VGRERSAVVVTSPGGDRSRALTPGCPAAVLDAERSSVMVPAKGLGWPDRPASV